MGCGSSCSVQDVGHVSTSKDTTAAALPNPPQQPAIQASPTTTSSALEAVVAAPAVVQVAPIEPIELIELIQPVDLPRQDPLPLPSAAPCQESETPPLPVSLGDEATPIADGAAREDTATEQGQIHSVQKGRCCDTCQSVVQSDKGQTERDWYTCAGAACPRHLTLCHQCVPDQPVAHVGLRSDWGRAQQLTTADQEVIFCRTCDEFYCQDCVEHCQVCEAPTCPRCGCEGCDSVR